MGHVLKKDENDWVRRNMSLEVDENSGRERLRLTWQNMITRDMKASRLKQEDAQNRQKSRKLKGG